MGLFGVDDASSNPASSEEEEQGAKGSGVEASRFASQGAKESRVQQGQPQTPDTTEAAFGGHTGPVGEQLPPPPASDAASGGLTGQYAQTHAMRERVQRE